MMCVKKKKGHLGKDCQENKFFKDKSKEGEKCSFYAWMTRIGRI